MMAADGLEPPDLVHIAECDAVHLVRAVTLQKLAQPPNAVASALYIGQHERDHVLFADATGDRGHVALLAFGAPCGLVDDERVRAEHTRVRSDGFRGAHAHVKLVEACRRPRPVALDGIGHGGVAHGIIRQLDSEVRSGRTIGARLFARMDNREALGLKLPVRGVLVASDDSRAVVARLLADENGSAGHEASLLECTDHVPERATHHQVYPHARTFTHPT